MTFQPITAAQAAELTRVFTIVPVGILGHYPISFRAHYALYAVICGTERSYSNL